MTKDELIDLLQLELSATGTYEVAAIEGSQISIIEVVDGEEV